MSDLLSAGVPARAQPPGVPPAPPRHPARALTRAEKAAVIVRLLTREGAELPLSELEDPMQARLTEAMGHMTYVDRVTLAGVIREFAEELENVGLPMPRGLVGALDALEGRLNPRTAARLRKAAGVRQTGDPWARLRAMEVADLRDIANREAVEVAAVLLSKLETTKAAELLTALPGDRARRIAYAISMTDAITPEAVDRIGFSLVAQLEERPDRAFDGKPEERVGEILNFSASATRDDVLTGLDETDRDFAENVRRAIFTFAHIPDRIEGRDIPRIARELDQADLVTALAAAEQLGFPDSAAYVLDNMSKRLADGIREEIGERGKVRQKDGEAAMGLFVAALRRLVSEGEISMRASEDEEG